jgi:hypothetical protein
MGDAQGCQRLHVHHPVDRLSRFFNVDFVAIFFTAEQKYS